MQDPFGVPYTTIPPASASVAKVLGMPRSRSKVAARIGNTSPARFDRCASYTARQVNFSGGVSSSTITKRSMSLSRVASPGPRAEQDHALRLEIVDHRVEEITRDEHGAPFERMVARPPLDGVPHGHARPTTR